MSTHPDIDNSATEERIRTVAFRLWEDDGRPDGRAEIHWLKACELVAAETSEPAWLQRIEPPVAEKPAETEAATSIEQLSKRIAGLSSL